MKVPRWASVAALCALALVYVIGLLLFRSAAREMREVLRETHARVPLPAVGGSIALDLLEGALTLGGLALVAVGTAVEFFVKRRWIAVVVYVCSAALYVAALFAGYYAIAGAVGG